MLTIDHDLNNENTKRNLIAENSTKFLQTEITGLA